VELGRFIYDMVTQLVIRKGTTGLHFKDNILQWDGIYTISGMSLDRKVPAQVLPEKRRDIEAVRADTWIQQSQEIGSLSRH